MLPCLLQIFPTVRGLESTTLLQCIPVSATPHPLCLKHSLSWLPGADSVWFSSRFKPVISPKVLKKEQNRSSRAATVTTSFPEMISISCLAEGPVRRRPHCHPCTGLRPRILFFFFLPPRALACVCLPTLFVKIDPLVSLWNVCTLPSSSSSSLCSSAKAVHKMWVYAFLQAPVETILSSLTTEDLTRQSDIFICDSASTPAQLMPFFFFYP